MKKSLIAVALCLMITPLVSCGGGDVPPPTPPTPTEKEFNDAYFNSLTVDYDGKEHILEEVGGVPEGTNIVYDGRVPHIDVGSYEASATLSKEGYKTKTLTATLTIKDQEFKNVYFDNVTVDYDGSEHILGEVRGAPEGTQIAYSGRESHTDVGVYEASATLSKEGYKSKTLTATLTIKGIDFTNVYFDNVTVNYDGQPHILGEVRGAPEGTNITYSGRESHTDVGAYSATATLSKKGYNTKTLTATLTIKSQEFTGVEFKSKEVQYDGNAYILDEVTGAPEGTNISYSGRESHTDVGAYSATATLTKTGYVTKTLTATLTITKGEFTDLSYDSKTVIYDGSDHIKDVKLVGNIPQSATVTETITDSSGQKVKEAIEVGTYNYHVVVEDKNYVTYTNDATLTIKLNKTDMAVFAASDGTIYFANGQDNRYLYSLSNNTFKRLDYSTPKEFNKYSPSKALYIAGTPLLNVVKEVGDDKTKANVIYTDGNIDDFVKYSDSIYYYSSNSLTSEKSGIYKVDATNSEDEPIVTKIFSGKSDSLAIYGGNLYFVNKSNNDYIYKIDLSSQTSSLVLEEKVHEFTINNGKLYCTINGTLNDYIGYIDLSSASSEVETLTQASGEFLTIKNNKLYYNYTDLFGVIDPDNYGVWSIDLLSKDKVHHVKTLNVNGFDVESNGSIVYTNTQDLHLYRYNPSSKVTTDLLKDFVVPEVTPINTGGRTIAHNNKIYYLNMYADKTLYVYDENTGKNHQLSTGKVEDFFIYDDKIYFNLVTRFTNNDIYVADLNAGTPAVKISTNDVRGMICDGTYIYGIHYNWAGITGAGLSRMKLDGSEYVKFSEVNGAKNLVIKDDRLYYINAAISNGDIESVALSDITPTTTDLKGENLSDNIKNVRQFIFDGDDIFYIYDGSIDNSLRRTDFTTLEEGTKLASSKTNPNEMILKDDFVYYYSYPSSSAEDAGFYTVSKTATDESTKTKIFAYDGKYYASALAFSGSNLYFLNYMISDAIPPLPLGDAHTYQLNLDTKAITKIA